MDIEKKESKIPFILCSQVPPLSWEKYCIFLVERLTATSYLRKVIHYRWLKLQRSDHNFTVSPPKIDIIILAGLALIGTEDNIDIKHVS